MTAIIGMTINATKNPIVVTIAVYNVSPMVFKNSINDFMSFLTLYAQ